MTNSIFAVLSVIFWSLICMRIGYLFTYKQKEIKRQEQERILKAIKDLWDQETDFDPSSIKNAILQKSVEEKKDE